nr:hotdog fold domain-containing protein [Corynebacterium hylobatis]
MLHGGISLGFSELAARKAWEQSENFPGEPFRTASLRMSYLRPGVLDGDLRIVVDIIHSSRSVVLAEVCIRNADGSAATFGLATLHRVATM